MKHLENLFMNFEDDFDEVFESFYNFKSDPSEKTKEKLLDKIQFLNRGKNKFTQAVKDYIIIKKEPII